MGPISERFCLFSCFVLFLLFVVCLSVCGLLCLLLSRTVFMYVNDIVSFCLWFVVCGGFDFIFPANPFVFVRLLSWLGLAFEFFVFVFSMFVTFIVMCFLLLLLLFVCVCVCVCVCFVHVCCCA